MITLDLSLGVFVYVSLCLGIVLGLWFCDAYRSRYDSDAINDQEVFRCGICTHVYVKAKDEAISRCPRCHSLN